MYYSLVSDNFHDFFTEYIPFAEDAVGYFEEREFRRRFPNTALEYRVHNEKKVTIPSKSGISSRVADETSGGSESVTGKGRHMSALEENKPTAAAPKEASSKKPPPKEPPSKAPPATGQPPRTTDTKPSADKVSKAGSEKQATLSGGAPLVAKDAVEAKPAKEKKPEKSKADLVKASQPKPISNVEHIARVEEAPKPAPAPPIDHLTVPNAEEPVVQDAVKLLNDIITVVNADNASAKYSSAISKAKEDLTKVIEGITTIKATEQKLADEKLRASHAEFDKAAKELVRRLEAEMRDQETHWREEYEAEREKLSHSYQHKLKSELDAARAAYEQRIKNELLERSIELTRQFGTSVKDRVETERSGRLSKLSELSESVQELERLTSEWNAVVDANLSTQHLHVALDTVVAKLDTADRPVPFLSELVALKEVSGDDPVVSAAINTIPPPAYQRGIPTPAQLLDRFRAVAAEVRKAALVPEHAGVASHAASWALSKLMVKKDGIPIGSDVESVLARTERWLEEGDLESAAREVNGLRGWAKVLASDWLKDVRKVCEVRQALDVSLHFVLLSEDASLTSNRLSPLRRDYKVYL